MPALPTGTVTFLFTDIEGSTALLQRLAFSPASDLASCVTGAVTEVTGSEVLVATTPRECCADCERWEGKQ